jgi:hypothetical protein
MESQARRAPLLTISVKLAAPVARQGLPKKPWRNLTTRKLAKLGHKAAATERSMYIANVMI